MSTTPGSVRRCQRRATANSVMAVSQASHGAARSSSKYTHTGKRVSVGAASGTAVNVVRVAVVGTCRNVDVCCTVNMSAVMDVKASRGVI